MSGGAGACSITGTTLTASDVGSCIVTVTKAADLPFPEQTATVRLSVTPATQAPITISVTPTNLAVGQTSTLAAQGGSGTGQMQFHLRNGVGFGICQIQGNTLTALAPGNCDVYARKDGDAHHYVASSNAVEVTVNGGPEVFSDGFEAPAPDA